MSVLRAPEISCSSVLASPHPNHVPLSRFPTSEGYEDRKGLRDCPLASWTCLITLGNRRSYLCFVKLQLKLYLGYRNNFSSSHPINQHGIQWRTSPCPDRHRPLGR